MRRPNVKKELKNFNSKLVELGIYSNNTPIKVERGKPHEEGVYEI